MRLSLFTQMAVKPNTSHLVEIVAWNPRDLTILSCSCKNSINAAPTIDDTSNCTVPIWVARKIDVRCQRSPSGLNLGLAHLTTQLINSRRGSLTLEIQTGHSGSSSKQISVSCTKLLPHLITTLALRCLSYDGHTILGRTLSGRFLYSRHI